MVWAASREIIDEVSIEKLIQSIRMNCKSINCGGNYKLLREEDSYVEITRNDYILSKAKYISLTTNTNEIISDIQSLYEMADYPSILSKFISYMPESKDSLYSDDPDIFSQNLVKFLNHTEFNYVL
jgi:hypothetical protein